MQASSVESLSRWSKTFVRNSNGCSSVENINVPEWIRKITLMIEGDRWKVIIAYHQLGSCDTEEQNEVRYADETYDFNVKETTAYKALGEAVNRVSQNLLNHRNLTVPEDKSPIEVEILGDRPWNDYTSLAGAGFSRC